MEYFSLTYNTEKMKYVAHNPFYSFLQVKQYIFTHNFNYEYMQLFYNIILIS